MNTTNVNDGKKMADKKTAGKSSTDKNSGKDAGKAVKKSPAKK
ncbi:MULTISPECIES: hypothetical protein [Flavobacterium]|nr:MULTISPECIES: hypothetical protein [Flavobacterium]